MKILKLVLRSINWMVCLALRFTAWSANRIQQKLQSGPGARLWAATDEQLLAEIQKRGLSVQKAKATDLVQSRCGTQEDDATLVVMRLQQVPRTAAKTAVEKAISEMRGKSWTVQDVVTKAIKYA